MAKMVCVSDIENIVSVYRDEARNAGNRSIEIAMGAFMKLVRDQISYDVEHIACVKPRPGIEEFYETFMDDGYTWPDSVVDMDELRRIAGTGEWICDD